MEDTLHKDTKHDLQQTGPQLVLQCNNLVMVAMLSLEHTLPPHPSITCLSHQLTVVILLNQHLVDIPPGTRRLHHLANRLPKAVVMITTANNLVRSNSNPKVVLLQQITPDTITISHQLLVIINKGKPILRMVIIVDIMHLPHNLVMVSLSLRGMISKVTPHQLMVTQPKRVTLRPMELKGTLPKHLCLSSLLQWVSKVITPARSLVQILQVTHPKALLSQVMQFPLLHKLDTELNQQFSLDTDLAMDHRRLRNLQLVSQYMGRPNSHLVHKEVMLSLLLFSKVIHILSHHLPRLAMLNLIQVHNGHHLV